MQVHFKADNVCSLPVSVIYPMGLNECSRKPHVLFYYMLNKFQWSLGAQVKKEGACL